MLHTAGRDRAQHVRPEATPADRRPGAWEFTERWSGTAQARDQKAPTHFDYLLEKSHKKDDFIYISVTYHLCLPLLQKHTQQLYY